MYLLNGEHKRHIDFLDRGFQYGDGLFETIEILGGIPIFFEQHLQRLLKGCEKLLIPPPDIKTLTEEAWQLAQHSDKAVLKITITRGTGGRGYRLPETPYPTRLLSVFPFPAYAKNFSKQGIITRFCNNPLGLNPALAGIKHMNRLEQVIARAEWDSPTIQEGLMLDNKGNIVEGTMSNIFLVKDNSLYTPTIDQCGVEGIVRNIIISLAKKNQVPVTEKTLCKQDLHNADELFITNSIIGIWPIKQLGEQHYKIGSVTNTFQTLFLAFKQRNIDNAC